MPGRLERLDASLRSIPASARWTAGAVVGLVLVAALLLWLLGPQAPSTPGEVSRGSPVSSGAPPDEVGPSGTEADPAGAEPAPPAGLAAAVGERVREDGFEPRILRSFAPKAEGPEDAVVLSLAGLDRPSFRRLIGGLVGLFPSLTETPDRPALRRLSLVLTDTTERVHKHELLRDQALRAAAEPAQLEALVRQLGVEDYPGEAASPPTAEEAPADWGMPLQAENPEGALVPGGEPEHAPEAAAEPAPSEPVQAGKEGQEAPSPEDWKEMGYTPKELPAETLRGLVLSRFPDMDVEVQGDDLVIRGPANLLPTVAIFLSQHERKVKADKRR